MGFENKFNDDNDFIENILEKKTDNKKSELDILKELFNKNNVETKTDLSMNQIIIINKKRMIAKMLDFKDLDYCLNDFMVLSISNKRQGRKEFIEGFKGRQDREENINNGGSGGLSRLFGGK